MLPYKQVFFPTAHQWLHDLTFILNHLQGFFGLFVCVFVFPGLCVYFGYGIWHSKEGLRELQPKDMAARYVVLPSGSLVETVQSVQPEGQADMAHRISPSSDSTVEESLGKRWYVTKYRSVPLPLIHFIT